MGRGGNIIGRSYSIRDPQIFSYYVFNYLKILFVKLEWLKSFEGPVGEGLPNCGT